jgi:hypothetical protein
MFLNNFDVLILKIFFKNKKYYFNIFLIKKYFKKQQLPPSQTPPKYTKLLFYV